MNALQQGINARVNSLGQQVCDRFCHADGDGSEGSGRGGGTDTEDADRQQHGKAPLFTKDDITTFAIALGCSFLIRSYVASTTSVVITPSLPTTFHNWLQDNKYAVLTEHACMQVYSRAALHPFIVHVSHL